jgi:transcription termination factor NusB
MPEIESSSAAENEGASNLRAIFEILSYILVDAQRDNQDELADRIEFALNFAEKLVKETQDKNESLDPAISPQAPNEKPANPGSGQIVT